VELGNQDGVDVDLTGAPIGDADLPAILTALQAFPAVRAFSVMSTNVTSAGAAQIRQALPKAQVLP
jgi:hypothetical protein